MAYYLQGLNDRAIADVEAALALKADFGRAYGIRGRVYFALGEFDLAIADLEKGLKLDPNLGDWAKSALAEARAAKAALADREKAANTGARIAMVIGNSKYEHDAELPNSRRDAKAVASQFKALGYTIFGDPERDYTKAQMEAEIEAFRKAVVGADAAILWYTGHGQKMREEGAEYADDWVIPVDAKIKKRADISKAAVRVERLKNSVLAAKTLRLVVIDACRDSKFYTGAMGVGGMGDRTGLKGALVVYSTQPGNVADAGPDNGRSPFTQAFLELLPANAKADIRKFFAAVVARTLQLNSDQRPEPIDGLATDQDVTLAK